MRFIDLFAGLGGFHLALKALGHTCVFACEKESHLQDLYERNFGLRPVGDIRQIPLDSIPPHDILCAGFPCQPFSKAGEQNGFECPKWGDLIEYVLAILDRHGPTYFILENVPNLAKHRSGETWRSLQSRLRERCYDIDSQKLSPHAYGIPQVRDRMFIVGRRGGLDGFEWPKPEAKAEPDLRSQLERNPPNSKPLSVRAVQCLEVWQEFLDLFPADLELPSFPIWTMEFGATYPFEDRTPFTYGSGYLRRFKGACGQPLNTVPGSRLLESLPAYAQNHADCFPHWKIKFIQQNRSFYSQHEEWLYNWLPKIQVFPPSYQKFEWNCKGCPRNIWDYIIQFRASGIRVKRPTTSPSLVAMTTSQVPIIGWERRYMTPREGARLQSMGDLLYLPEATTHAYKALGNAVNVELVRLIANSLLSQQTEEPSGRAQQLLDFVQHSDYEEVAAV